jgi:hypothetical protein
VHIPSPPRLWHLDNSRSPTGWREPVIQPTVVSYLQFMKPAAYVVSTIVYQRGNSAACLLGMQYTQAIVHGVQTSVPAKKDREQPPNGRTVFTLDCANVGSVGISKKNAHILCSLVLCCFAILSPSRTINWRRSQP